MITIPESDCYLENPPEKLMVVLGIILFFAFNAVGLSLAITATESFAMMIWIVSFLIASLYVAGMLLGVQYLVRPKGVMISDPLVIYYRGRKPIQLPLDRIEWAYARPGSYVSLSGVQSMVGGVKIMGGRRLRLTFEVGKRIQEEYAKKYGHYPPLPPPNV
jgi:hypothetical protein